MCAQRKNGAAVQLELAFWPESSLRRVLADYMARQSDHVAEATIRDYADRAAWLLGVLGEETEIERLSFAKLEMLARAQGPKGAGLMMETLKKRFTFLRAACTYAWERGIIDKPVRVPRIKTDSKPRTRVLSLAEWRALREHLIGRARRFFDLAFLTGMHSSDIFRLKRSHLDPDHVWRDEDGHEIGRGRWWRMNTKNKKCVACWLPMEPELLELSREILAEPLPPNALIVGRVHGLAKSFHAAADRAQAPRWCPLDLRRSFASLLMSRGHGDHYMRMALGHEGLGAGIPDRESQRPSILSRHYLRVTEDVVRSELRLVRLDNP